MVDQDVILAKADAIEKHLKRIQKVSNITLQAFLNMVKAIGFRNLIVHEYGKLYLKRVYDISKNDINDLHGFLKAVITRYR
ncbi:MAG: HepT-like ribonuclease domain-containing protein [Thermodesulfobacteriota bacterium]|nr:HepT-like ribonuclease domain-containing protein [Thermodesulfobacteriota bacterium]